MTDEKRPRRTKSGAPDLVIKDGTRKHPSSGSGAPDLVIKDGTRKHPSSGPRRDLDPEERALWDKVAETIRPLPGRRARAPENRATAKTPPAPKARPSAPPAAAPAKPKPPPLAPLEPKLTRTLKRGGEVDARFDLHGYRQEEAHRKLISFLRGQRTRGARIVLVITGKSGVLNRAVPLWLAEPSLRDIVIGFSQAAPAHGGAGALYVRLRRER